MARSNISSDKSYRNVNGVRDKTIRSRLSCPQLSDNRLARARKEQQRSDLRGQRPISGVRGEVVSDRFHIDEIAVIRPVDRCGVRDGWNSEAIPRRQRIQPEVPWS